MAGTGLPTHHVDVCVVNECLLEALVEEDDDGVHQVASVRDAGQETPDAAREQLVYRTCGGKRHRPLQPRAPLVWGTPCHRRSLCVLHLSLWTSRKVFFRYIFKRMHTKKPDFPLQEMRIPGKLVFGVQFTASVWSQALSTNVPHTKQSAQSFHSLGPGARCSHTSFWALGRGVDIARRQTLCRLWGGLHLIDF